MYSCILSKNCTESLRVTYLGHADSADISTVCSCCMTSAHETGHNGAKPLNCNTAVSCVTRGWRNTTHSCACVVITNGVQDGSHSCDKKTNERTYRELWGTKLS